MSVAAGAETSAVEAVLSDVVQEFVNRISHSQGKTLAVLTDASMTLQQVLVLRRLASVASSAVSPLADEMHVSLPAMSQMIERLFQLEMVSRVESADDRRKKTVSITPRGRGFLKRIAAARSADYAAGLAPLSPRVKTALGRLLKEALGEL